MKHLNNIRQHPTSNATSSAVLHDAIRAGNFEKLRGLVSAKKKIGDSVLVQHSTVTRQQTNVALFFAVYRGCVESCRILWNGLGKRAKQIYTKSLDSPTRTNRSSSTSSSINYPLHSAVYLGRFEIVRLFIQEFHWNVNQTNGLGHTPLSCAINNVEMTRFLLQNGANANVRGGGVRGNCSPLVHAVEQNSIDVVRLLLENGADPNQKQYRGPVDDEDDVENQRGTCSRTAHTRCRPIDIVIQNGHAEILSLLFQCGALVGYHNDNDNKDSVTTTRSTSLNRLLHDSDKSRETKLVICHMLVFAINVEQSSSSFLKQSLRFEINKRNFGNVEILVEAGVEPTVHAWNVTIRANQQALCRLMLLAAANGGGGGGVGGGAGVDHFQEYVQGYNDDDGDAYYGISPFHTAARQVDTTIFKSFLIAWDERFATSSSSGGKNESGEHPIHAICRDGHVSLQAVQLLLSVEQLKQQHQHQHQQQRQALPAPLPASLEKLHGRHFAFEIAAMADASIDVIFTLLQHCLDAVFCSLSLWYHCFCHHFVSCVATSKNSPYAQDIFEYMKEVIRRRPMENFDRTKSMWLPVGAPCP
jgi:ankyrin repeat protein